MIKAGMAVFQNGLLTYDAWIIAILIILIFSLTVTVSLLGYVAFTSPREKRVHRH